LTGGSISYGSIASGLPILNGASVNFVWLCCWQSMDRAMS